MKINHALDWQEVHTKLKRDLSTIGHNPDLRKMLNNISDMVTELSKIEVTARRVQSTTLVADRVTAINSAISHLSKLILIAQLMS